MTYYNNQAKRQRQAQLLAAVIREDTRLPTLALRLRLGATIVAPPHAKDIDTDDTDDHLRPRAIVRRQHRPWLTADAATPLLTTPSAAGLGIARARELAPRISQSIAPVVRLASTNADAVRRHPDHARFPVIVQVIDGKDRCRTSIIGESMSIEDGMSRRGCDGRNGNEMAEIGGVRPCLGGWVDMMIGVGRRRTARVGLSIRAGVL